MVLVSYSGREINAKIVFYGPGLCGKTTNLEYIYGSIPSQHRGKMVSMKTKTERTLFFDFLPLNLGELAGFKTRFLLYTVPGQVYYNATRKLVLKGADAIVFVADSQRGKMDENLESFQNLRDNLSEQGLSLDEIPYVIQYNKRDLSEIYSVHELETAMNKVNVPSFEAVATTGVGVFETFKSISKLLLTRLSSEIGANVVKQDETVWSGEQRAESAETQSHPEAPPGQLESSVAPGIETVHATAADAPEAANSKEMPVAQPSNDDLVLNVSKDGLADDASRPLKADERELAAAEGAPAYELSNASSAQDAPEDGTADKRGSPGSPRGLWRWLRKGEPAAEVDRETLEVPHTPGSEPALPVEQEETPLTCASPDLKPPPTPAEQMAPPAASGSLELEPPAMPAEQMAPPAASDSLELDPPVVPAEWKAPPAASTSPVPSPEPAATAPDRVKAAGDRTRQAPEPGATAPPLAKVSRMIEVQHQEILVPVLIPRSTIGDRVILRIDLRFVQDLDLPQESNAAAPASEEAA